jgi:hypothetical protein
MRRKYTFRVQPDASIEELAQFLAARVRRPVVGHFPEDSQFQVAVYHRRILGGTNGMLEIGQVSIQYIRLLGEIGRHVCGRWRGLRRGDLGQPMRGLPFLLLRLGQSCTYRHSIE